MPFEIIRNDITKMAVDAIVNTANPFPTIGLGTDSQIHEKAGPELLKARQLIGRIDTGSAALTPAFRLPARYVIHTVGPVWVNGSYGEEAALRSCFDQSLELALENHCQSIAFPLISTGNYGFPQDKALQIAVAAFSAFLMHHEMQIYLVVFNREAYLLSEKLFQSVTSYIDQNYVDTTEETLCFKASAPQTVRAPRRNIARVQEEYVCAPAPEPLSLEQALQATDIGFSEALRMLIDQSGKKDSEIYKKANLSKQHFSKIRNNPNYQPTKPTALALAVALELNLEQTKELIGRAGFALTNSSKQDLIVRYFIENKNYNIIDINIALYEFDQGLLGSA